MVLREVSQVIGDYNNNIPEQNETSSIWQLITLLIGDREGASKGRRICNITDVIASKLGKKYVNENETMSRVTHILP